MDQQSQEESDLILCESNSTTNFYQNPKQTPSEGQTKLDPALLKALKLFAKNHQQLEKAQDLGQRQKRVLSSDGRTLYNNIAAFIYEMSGQPIPKGPKFINEPVERELDMYKKEVEEKFKTSYMNNTYQFPRRQISKICRTGPERSVERDQHQNQILKNEILFLNKEGRQRALNDMNQQNEMIHKTFDKGSSTTQENSIKRNTIKMPAKLIKSFINSPKEKQQKSNKSSRITQYLQEQVQNIPKRQQMQHQLNDYATQNHSQDRQSGKQNQVIDQSFNPVSQNIVIHKPIVIQFQNKKITFVNAPKSNQQSNKSSQRLKKVSAQRSPRNKNQNNLKQNFQENSSIERSGQVLFPQDFNQRKQQQSQPPQKNQVSSILQQILQLDLNKKQHQEHIDKEPSFTNNSYQSNMHQTKLNYPVQSPYQQNFNLNALSKTEDSRAQQKQNLNFSKKNKSKNDDTYKRQISNEKSILNAMLSLGSKATSSQPKTQSQIRVKSNSGEQQLILNNLAEKQTRVLSSNTRKQTPSNGFHQAMRESIEQIGLEKRSTRKKVKRQSQHNQPPQFQNLTNIAKSMRTSLMEKQISQEDRMQYNIDESFRIMEALRSQQTQRKNRIKKVYQTNINSPATELEMNDKLTNQYQAYMIANQEKQINQKMQRINISRIQNNQHYNQQQQDIMNGVGNIKEKYL